ncbi:MAG: addiction module protein [Pirellulaceae bacterium]|nr:addiction module protein [Pirellulaceae bacterium]
MASILQLTEEALALPLEERIRLAQRLWASLNPTADASEKKVQEAEALDLAERRDAELDRGSVQAVSHSEAIARARKSLGCE